MRSATRQRRIVGSALALTMLAAACAGDGGETGGAAPDEGGGDDAPIEADEDAFVIGAVLPAAGVYAQLGPDIEDGMRLYFEEVGYEAGGTEIEMVVRDETADPQTAVERTRGLIDEGVDAIAGFVGTPAIYGARDIIDEAGVPTVVSNAGGNDLTGERRSDWIYRASFTSAQVSGPLGEWVFDNIGDRAAIVAADYAFGTESADAFREAFEEAGGEIVDEILVPLGTTDFSSAVANLAGLDADATFGFFAGSDGVGFTQAYRDAGLNDERPLAVAGFVVESDVLDAAGEAALGAFSSLHWAPTLDLPENEEFVSSYEEAYGRQPSVYSLQGYDTARVFVEALEATGGDTDPDAVIEAIAEVEFDSPRGPFRFDPETNQVVQNMYVREVQEVDGELTNQVIDELGEIGDPTA